MDPVVKPLRSCASPAARAAALAALTCAFVGLVQAGVQIVHDPMRPALPLQGTAASVEAGGSIAASGPVLPTLRITRALAAAGELGALVDDTWVRRGDVVAGYRVTALRHESIDLVKLDDPTQRLTLRLNPIAVERHAGAPPPPAWPALALERKP